MARGRQPGLLDRLSPCRLEVSKVGRGVPRAPAVQRLSSQDPLGQAVGAIPLRRCHSVPESDAGALTPVHGAGTSRSPRSHAVEIDDRTREATTRVTDGAVQFNRVYLLSGGARFVLRAGRRSVPENRGNAHRSPLGLSIVPISICPNWWIVTLNFTASPKEIKVASIWPWATNQTPVRTGFGRTRFVTHPDLHTTSFE